MSANPTSDIELERIARERKAREATAPGGQAKAEAPPQLLPPPTDPMAVARKFVEHCCLHNGAAGELTLRCWQGGWWAWRTTHWIESKNARCARCSMHSPNTRNMSPATSSASHLGSRRGGRSAICLRR